VNKRARRAHEVVVEDEEARPPPPPLRRGLALIILFVEGVERIRAREQKNKKFEDDAKSGRGSKADRKIRFRVLEFGVCIITTRGTRSLSR